MATRNTSNLSVLMLPWLAHGHISPCLDLAKKLSTRNFNIFLCSTPINLESVKNKVTGKWSEPIQLVELNLPPSPDLPPHYHTTNGLPPHLMGSLETAFADSSANFLTIFESVKPDMLIYDYNQSWATDIALSNNIPAVQFLLSSAIFSSLRRHMLYCDSSVTYPFPISIHKYFTEKMKARLKSSPDDAKTSREIEGKYVDYISNLSQKKTIPVGSLVQESLQETGDDCTETVQFLDKKDESSVVFVSFGSEYFLTKEENPRGCIWIGAKQAQLHMGYRENTKIEEALPIGFLDRVGDRGLVVEGWAPQARILHHSSTGGFISHCGWSSIMESMMFGVPVIAMPMHIDQPFNTVVVKEVGVGQEVERDEDGRFRREEIAKVIRNVVIEKSGEIVRRKAKEMREMIREKGEKEIDEVVGELVNLCKEKKDKVTSSTM
ncbi:hypothetical protein ACET3Z_006383 [Daucus carota]